MKKGGTGRLNGPVLVLAYPDDPVAMGFSQYASKHGLRIWQPKRLEDLAWSYSLDSDVEIYDRVSGRRWKSCELAGIWYQASPPLTTLQDFEGRQRCYILAELNGAMRAVWDAARCVVIGQAWAATTIIDCGLESRVELRRLGLPTLTDRIGSLQFLRATLGATRSEDVWITRTQGASAWLSDILAASQPGKKPDLVGDELVVATATDNRQTCVALHVDASVLVVELDGDNVRCMSPQDQSAAQIKSIVQTISTLTATRMGVIYFARQHKRWMVARLSLQIPYWLNEIAAAWLFPRLLKIFANSSKDHLDAGSTQ